MTDDRSMPTRRRSTIRLARAAVLGLAATVPVAVQTVVAPTPAAAATGDITTIAGGIGPSTPLAAGMAARRLAVFGTGMAIADDTGATVRFLDNDTALSVVVGQAAGGSPIDGAQATATPMRWPSAVAYDTSGNLFVALTSDNQIWRADAGTHVFTRFAGGNGTGSDGDGGQATAAHLNHPAGLTVAADGRVFIADTGNHKIRVVATNGVITTVAGTGSAGGTGDGGLATAAKLSSPADVAIDGGGNIVVSDSGNHRIRKFAVGGTMVAVAGNGTKAFAGDNGSATSASLDSPDGIAVSGTDLYVADSGNRRVRKVSGGTITTVAGSDNLALGDGGPATSAGLIRPTGVAVRNGALYIADYYHYRVRKVVAGVITTVAGNGTAQFSGEGTQATSAQIQGAAAVAYAPNGDLYFADTWNGRIRKRATTGLVTTVAGGGSDSTDGAPALDAVLDFPDDVALDAQGNLYFTDFGSNRVRRVDVATNTVTTVAGTGVAGFSGDAGPATTAQLQYARGVAVDTDGAVYIADGGNHRVRRVDPVTKIITTIAGTGVAGSAGDGGAATAAQLDDPFRVLPDGKGSVYVADDSADRVRRIGADGKITAVAGSGGSNDTGDGGLAVSAGLDDPKGLAMDAAGNLYIGTRGHVRRVNPFGGIDSVAGSANDGWFAGDGGPATSAVLNDVWGLAISPAGDLTLADYYNNRIRRIQGTAVQSVKYHPLTPARIADSRDGTGGFNTPWGPGTTREVQVTGVGGVPATGVTSVVLNITVTGGTATSHLRVWPAGTPRPATSSLNWGAGDTRPNLVPVKVGAGGKVSIFNNSGTVHVIADVVGWYDNAYNLSGDRFTALTPARVLDSRDGTGGFNTPWGAGTTRSVTVAGAGGVPASGVTAVVLNVTVTQTSAASHLTVWPDGQAKPDASNLNWPAGDTRPNVVVAKLGANGKVSIFNNAGNAHVIADVVGYYSSAGSAYFAAPPVRTLDTRDGTGGIAGPIGPGATVTLKVAGRAGVSYLATSVVLNVTVTQPSAGSHLTVWPTGQAKPVASNLNWSAGQTVPNLVVVKVGSNGSINLYNNSGTAHVIADVVGYYQ